MPYRALGSTLTGGKTTVFPLAGIGGDGCGNRLITDRRGCRETLVPRLGDAMTTGCPFPQKSYGLPSYRKIGVAFDIYLAFSLYE